MTKTLLIVIGLLCAVISAVGCSKSEELVSPISNTEVASETKALFIIEQDNMAGFINQNGKVVIKPQFSRCGGFHEELAWVGIGGKHGFMDTTGKLVIAAQFEGANDFSEGLARVKMGGKYGYIDKTGQIVINPQFDLAGDFSEGLAWVGTGKTEDVRKGFIGKYGYIDKTGKIVIPIEFIIDNYDNYLKQFSDGLALIKLKTKDSLVYGKYGYIDKTGKIAIEPQFTYARDFKEGLARVSGENRGYIDTTGKFVIKVPNGGDFSEGLAWAEGKVDGQYGYIDKTGKFIIDLQFHHPSENNNFSEGLAYVGSGWIDKTGKIVIKLKGDFGGGPFHKGLVQIRSSGWFDHPGVSHLYGYIDKTGKYVWKK